MGVLSAIRRLTKASRLSPSLQEIATELGVDVSVVSRSVAMLERDGYVSREPGKYRSLQLVTRKKAA